MARFVTVKRKYLLIAGLVVLVGCLGVLGVNIFGTTETSSTPEQVEPEMKILSVEFTPQIAIRNVKYGEEVFKGMQTLNKTDYKVSAVVQNMTEKTMTNIPIKLTIALVEDKNQKVSKEGQIPALEPGATAKVAFENIKALADAKGKSATAGQHEMILSIKANPEGSMTQNTEAKIIFNVDTTVK